MSCSEQIHPGPTKGILSDVVLIIIGTVICALLAVHFEWAEALFAWTRRSESFQLDELTFVLFFLAVGLAWFSARRWRSARRELSARLTAEAQLARTLDEQRRCARAFVDQQERERKRLSQELHDELAQFVNAIKIDAVSIRDSTPMTDHALVTISRRACDIIANADLVHESVARLIRELRPVGLDELGLSAAIEHCADLWRRRLEPAQLCVAIDERIDDLDEARTLVLYRTVQEALANCARHARANHIEVRIGWSDGGGIESVGASLHIEDDGIGIDLKAAPTGLGLGLIGMRERLTALGGSLRVESAPGTGFHLYSFLPASPPEAALG